jgi:hypothetical protein
MKGILAILAVGLMLATAFSGCVGSEKGTDGIDNGTGDNGGTGNETGNETGGNETGNVTLPDNYHEEHSDTLTIQDMAWVAHKFPVQIGAKKITIHLIPQFTSPIAIPDQGFLGGMDVTILDAKGNKLVDTALVNGEITYEFGPEAVTKSGKWSLEMFPEDPSVEVQSIIDVTYQ